jgi:tripartite-type tricarboxylate transporter receptor subunit TctC
MLGLIKKFGCLVATAALLTASGGARGEAFPSKPVHILVPYAAGGAVDVLARTLAQSLARIWGQQPVIDNRPGAGGIVASQALAQAPPDGTTLILVASGHPLNQFIYPRLPYDTFKDFTAISEIASSPLAILVAKTSAYANLQDILTAARKDPGALSYGMAGNGTSSHLAGELLKYMAGVKTVAIPYKGGVPALTAVIAGDIPVSFNPLAEAIGQVDGGSLRAIAVTSAQRSKTFPDVPTVAESGVPGYDVAVWWGFLGPAHMAPELVAKLETDLKSALQDPSVQTTLEKIGATPVGSGSKEFEAFLHSEAEKWQPVLKAANIRAE